MSSLADDENEDWDGGDPISDSFFDDDPISEDFESFGPDYPYGGEDLDFADPGGNSALRRATKDNPRNCPCSNCGRENVLTPKDVSLGYQCDSCADRAERGFDY